LLAVLVVLGIAAPAHAGITFFMPPGVARPDIHVEQLLVEYDGVSVLQIYGYNPAQPGLATPIEYRGVGGVCDPPACPFDQSVSSFSLTYDRNTLSGTYTLTGTLSAPPNGTLAGPKTLVGSLTDVEWTPSNTLKFLGTVSGADSIDFGFTTGFIGMQMVTDPIPSPPGGPFLGPDGWFNPMQGAFITGANSLDYFGQVGGGGQAVPEPSTIALLGLGLAALARARRK
jgi:hypothetical protein